MVRFLPLLVLAVLAGCQTGSPGVVQTARSSAAAVLASPTPAAAAGAVDTGIITGHLSVPTQLLGRVIPVGAGNVLGSNAASVVSAGGARFGVLALDTSPLQGVQVYLADAGDSPVPNLAAVTTDAGGSYTIPDVPAGYTFVVVADVPTVDGKTASFQTLAKSSKLGATANVDASTTLVTAALLQGLQGGDLGDYNPATFQAARQTTDAHLQTGDLPDFSDRSAVLAKIEGLVDTIAELKQSIDQMQQDLQDIQQTLSQIQQELASRPSPPPTPQARAGQLLPGQSPPPIGQCPPPVPSGAPPPANYPAECLDQVNGLPVSGTLHVAPGQTPPPPMQPPQ